jgi:hypothetical protein
LWAIEAICCWSFFSLKYPAVDFGNRNNLKKASSCSLFWTARQNVAATSVAFQPSPWCCWCMKRFHNQPPSIQFDNFLI